MFWVIYFTIAFLNCLAMFVVDDDPDGGDSVGIAVKATLSLLWPAFWAIKLIVALIKN